VIAGDRAGRYAALIGAVAITHAALAAGEARVLDVRLNERVLPPSQRVLVVREGEEVTIRWASNHPIRVRLQGYDLEASITPGRTVTMTFRASTPGRFKITTRDGITEGEAILGHLEVQAR
jgi:hypothetical protein